MMKRIPRLPVVTWLTSTQQNNVSILKKRERVKKTVSTFIDFIKSNQNKNTLFNRSKQTLKIVKTKLLIKMKQLKRVVSRAIYLNRPYRVLSSNHFHGVKMIVVSL